MFYHVIVFLLYCTLFVLRTVVVLHTTRGRGLSFASVCSLPIIHIVVRVTLIRLWVLAVDILLCHVLVLERMCDVSFLCL